MLLYWLQIDYKKIWGISWKPEYVLFLDIIPEYFPIFLVCKIFLQKDKDGQIS